MDSRKPAILAIDLLRFGAALLVVGYHLFAGFSSDPPDFTASLIRYAPIPAAWVDRSWFGWVGVEIFFVISGYVIARSIVGQDLAGFARRRALRLAPAALICASITAVILLGAARLAPAEIAAGWARSVLFWPAGVLIDPSYWTLGIELCFYALVGSRLGRADSGAAVVRLAWGIGTISTLFWTVHTLVPGFFVPNALERTVQLLLLRHGVFFALGVIAADAHAARVTARAVAGLALFGVVGLVEIADKARNVAFGLHRASHPAVAMAIFGTALAIVLAAPLLQRPCGRLVPAPVVARLGAVTYPLYLIHQNLSAWIVSALLAHGVGYGTAASVAIGTALALAFALLPAERRLGRWLAARIDRVVLSLRRAPARDTLRNASPPAG